MIRKQNYEEFDKKIKEQLQGHEASYDPTLWNDIEVFLNNQHPATQTFNKKLLIPGAAALGGLALIIILISYLSTREKKPVSDAPVQQATEEPAQTLKPAPEPVQQNAVVTDTAAINQQATVSEAIPDTVNQHKTEEKKDLTEEEKKIAREERRRKKRVRDSLNVVKQQHEGATTPVTPEQNNNSRLGAVEENNTPVEAPVLAPNNTTTSPANTPTEDNKDAKKKKKKGKKESADSTKTN